MLKKNSSIETPKIVDRVFVDDSWLYTMDTNRAQNGFKLRKKT
jgi:hypothetical protein